MKRFVLEICADSVESALIAHRAGATRIELCSNLIIGGTTPSIKTYEEIRISSDIETRLLIRPRFGDFCYSEHELAIMKAEIEMFRDAGADGVVIGVLKPDGSLNKSAMKSLMECAGDMRVTLHRAFDMARNPMETLNDAIELGVSTVLTSGQKNICEDGVELLSKLVEVADGRIEILAGAGVNSTNIKNIYETTGITSYHMSAKQKLDSKMEYRNTNVNMGIPGFSEYQLYQADEYEIARCLEVFRKI